MILVISRSQRKKIQWRYTQYQTALKENGESPSLGQSKGHTERVEWSNPGPKIKGSASREQLAKVHAELRAKERSSLAGLEKALIESYVEIDEELGQKKVLAEDEMFEVFMAE